MAFFKKRTTEYRVYYHFFGKSFSMSRFSLRKIYKTQIQITKKLSMINSTWKLGDVSFYVPNYPIDYVQSQIVDTNNFYEIELLRSIDNYIPENAVILDIGANIGNHSIYWASEKKASKIFSFEPVKETFDILHTNVNINKLNDIIEIFNFGLSDSESKGKINSYHTNNIGATCVVKSQNGSIQLKSLDEVDISTPKIDFVKIDVEGHEESTLKGMSQILTKHKPTVLIEIFSDNFKAADDFLKEIGFKLDMTLEGDNYIYVAR